MSANAASLPCPICLHTGVFHTAQSLKDRLIFVSTNNILCPICQEEVAGLDKLTIHLFSHIRIIPTQQPETHQRDENSEIKSASQQPTKPISESQKKVNVLSSKNKSLSSPNTQMKFVKIYPKLPVITLNTMPIIDITPNAEGSVQSSNNSLYIPTIKSETSLMTMTNKCDICGLQFVDANILRMHKCLIHNIEDSSHHTFTRYNCHLCPKNFKMRGSLMVHLRVAHYGFASRQNSETNTDTENKDRNGNHVSDDKPTDLERRDGKQWQCDVCRKCFTTKYFLKKHKRLHTGETPYACTQCNKTFTFQQSYHKHLLYHNDEKPHTCSFCGRSFKELSTLHNHQRIHTGEKPFACETCGKCFRQRVSYLVHRRIHTGAMPYKCTACDKSFRYKVSQRTHKCQVQPPGTVIRKMGDFVEKLKKKKESSDETLNSNEIDSQNNKYENTKYPEISEVNAELVRTGAQLSLEDMESENFTILSEAFGESDTPCSNYSAALPSNGHPQNDEKTIDISNIDELIDSIPANEKSIPSPSDILKKLCLSSEEEFFNVNQPSNNDVTYDMNKDLNDYL
ncbi:zinc finger protein 235 isoform X1 [Maniola jurtina]|uniref:zinc finger protein 235 isoform X1 n=1 Tax=Maniola jurtina TaxID=191418 RepID=UPI001E687A52|nr:zinc finger protein 235 isoform X1 [Maniola jurtina]